MSKVSFSIVIPLYNKERTIVNTVNSVLNQRFETFEIIIVDDGSTDESLTKVNSLTDDSIRIIRKKNSGVSIARNTGIESARYPWIVLLDGDDELKPEYLEKVHQMIRAYPKEKAFASGYVFQYKNRSQVHPNFYGVPDKGTFGIIPNYFESVLKGENVITGSSVCVHREVFETAGLFKAGYKLGEDLDMWFRIALNYNIVFCNTPLVIYHKDITNSATTQIDNVRNMFPYFHWFKAPRNKFDLPYQYRYIINRIAKAIYAMSLNGKLHHILRYFIR